MAYQKISVPSQGQKILVQSNGQLDVPNEPIIPFIEGDGTGIDVTPVMIKVVDAAVKQAYQDAKKIHWMEVYAGEKAVKTYGPNEYLPEETLSALREYPVSIKGPLTTPVGGGIRSINVALRQVLDLYVCLRPVRYFKGTPSPVREPEKTDMVIFRENSEDIYAGIEWPAGSKEVKQVIDFLQNTMGVKKIRFSEDCGIGIKPMSKAGTERLIAKAVEYTLMHNKPSLTIVHKGNIMKFTEGAFKDWGYAYIKANYNTKVNAKNELVLVHPKTQAEIVIKDCIADAFLQQILSRPAEYSVIACPNLNGDFISDALAAQVGGIGIAPGANLSDSIAVFEATHGTAPKYAGLDKVNPGSIILSAEMMLRHLGWNEAAELIVKAIEKAILEKKVTYDFERLMSNATLLKCSEFGQVLIDYMKS